MDGKIFIQKLRLQNFLSYGSEGEEIILQPLNVLIGPNGSGKSNLIEALAVLKAIPNDLSSAFRQGGGINHFLWKGTKEISIANIEVIINYPKNSHHPKNSQNLRYKLNLTANNQRLELIDEAVENEKADSGEDDVYFYYRYNKGNPVLNSKDSTNKRQLQREDLSLDQSVLSQRKDPESYPELSYINTKFSKISLYRHWQMGRYSEPRNPQPADLPIHPLEENGSNLGLFLNNLKKQIGHRAIIENLKKFYDSADEINVDIYGNTVQIFIREENLEQPIIPATRLSDGTLRYLFLMALLLDPTPPPLICIEEPEIGLHPDILSTIAEMLIDASKRTQIILTTHSDALVSALSEYPECILVCERDQQGTHLRRLEPDKLKNWLENYTLGDLWRMGEIGGNRW